MNTQRIYEGTACRKCGSTRRYVCNYSCVKCSLDRYTNRTPEQQAARKANAERYRAAHGHAYSKEKMREYNRIYNAKKRGLDPVTYKIRSEITAKDRLLKHSMPVTDCGCWVWLARLDKDGYGQFNMGGKPIPAHRASFKIFKHDVADDVVIRHTCDFPPCINPDHLLAGTHTDNAGDRVERGRDAKKGLTRTMVKEIRSRHASGEKQSDLAEAFMATPFVIGRIVSRKSWRHVP